MRWSSAPTPERPTRVVPMACCAAGRRRPDDVERRGVSPPVCAAAAGCISEEKSPMATPLDGSMTPPVREGVDDQPKSEERDNQDQTPTVQKRSSVLLRLCIGLVAGLLLAGGVVWLVNTIRKEIAAQVAQDNFRKIALAFQDYADAHRAVMPTQAIYDKKTGKPLLSWRVTILPFLGETVLYKQIRLDEPWDSPHNREFWDQMPKVYELSRSRRHPRQPLRPDRQGTVAWHGRRICAILAANAHQRTVEGRHYSGRERLGLRALLVTTSKADLVAEGSRKFWCATRVVSHETKEHEPAGTVPAGPSLSGPSTSAPGRGRPLGRAAFPGRFSACTARFADCLRIL
ncbi:MAG: DUF1559 domain-containing protein [Planctomycetes bacterium]|nr:DUF1559 domain-containing protein [Planctomycetota bacterium]